MPALDSDSDRLWTRRVLWLLFGALVFRVLYLLLAVDFQIAGDEAHYWEWGRRPDWGYFSKPPLIGWIMGVINAACGPSWRAIRIASILMGTVSLGALFVLGRRMFNARVGFVAVLLTLLTPANGALNNAMTIDAPLVLCWTLALLCFWQAAARPQAVAWWCALALVIGTGTLAKQMMLVFPVQMILFAAVAPEQRALLRRPAFWLSIAGGIAMFGPTLWWNQQHGWQMIKHTAVNVSGNAASTFSEHLAQVIEFPLVQALMYSVVTFGVAVAALISCWRTWRSQPLQHRFLWVFAVPPLLVFVGLSFYKEVNPNWPGVYYVSAFVLASAMLCSAAREWSRWLGRAVWTGAALMCVAYLIIPIVGWSGLVGHERWDRFRDMRGWEEVGKQLGAMYDKVPNPAQTFVCSLGSRQYTSQMAFWMPQHPTLYRYTRLDVVESQYEVWPNAADKIGWDALLIDPADDVHQYAKRDLSQLVRHSFRAVEDLGVIDVPIGNGTRRVFHVYLGKHMKRWPPSVSAEGVIEQDTKPDP